MTAGAPATDPAWKSLARSIRRTVRRTRNRIRRASVILLYHRVAEGFPDPWSLCVSPVNFREQLAVLASRGTRPLDALVDDVRGPGAPVVTFDDGYADFRTEALPVLRTHAIPVTLFVTTGTLGGGTEFWWDELERILAVARLPQSLAVEVGCEPFSWTFATDGDRRALYHALHQRIGRLTGASRTTVLADLRTWAGIDAGCRTTHRPLTAHELVAVAGETGVQIGAHTVSHSYLGALGLDEQRREIEGGKRALEAIIERPVHHFSYPHGDHEAETVACVREAGFRLACGSARTSLAGEVDAFDLPRVEVPNLSGAAFARWLDEWVG